MQGMIISNPKLEFLRPVLERWFDCIDRYNAVRGDSDTPYWHDEKANLGLLSAAAWMAEMVTLQDASTRKQNEEGERNARADLLIASTDERAFIQATQRWPKVNNLNLTQPLLEATSDAKRISYASDLKLGCLFVAPQKAQQSATPEELQDMIDDLQKENTCAVAWYFPYAYRKLRNETGHYHPGVAVLLKQAHG
ncbi:MULTISPECIES: hypothetical protein [Pseudomonas]|uniref:Uncharacterized protein n=1 Tax=Pseudomonas canavaninivorans TaxID=2842348 RepID=A0ABX8QHV2_PSECO|nr:MULTISPECIES: hypothetical protein [Pseudomonas]MBJ2349913.1 hypothetical protein [Pseudomonas canavaninivorans]MBL3545303.1 hypothetical protein [Pseudomonas sp. HB05]QXI54877.1 hypothetical protein KSS97_08050 [Pseudomonas alvandae]UVM73907.1 hypothetical protein LOY40_07015 [Pseudomonas canavaninivorans]